jgi:cytidine deaminase
MSSGHDPGEFACLREAAASAIIPVFRAGRHEIAAAFLTADGQVFTGINLKAVIGRASVCAEATALSAALITGPRSFRAAAAFIRTCGGLRPVPPCGPCRELIADYAPAIRIYIDTGGTITSIAIGDLLPHKYTQD